MKSINKKGVSPLIATVLLIAFAVALGAVVMNWGRNIEFSQSEDKCAGVGIKVRETKDYAVCYSGTGNNIYLNFIIDNIGKQDLYGLSIWVVGSKGTRLFELKDILIKKGTLFDKKDNELTYELDTYGEIKHLQFIPKIKIDDTIDICPKNSVRADKINRC